MFVIALSHAMILNKYASNLYAGLTLSFPQLFVQGAQEIAKVSTITKIKRRQA